LQVADYHQKRKRIAKKNYSPSDPAKEAQSKKIKAIPLPEALKNVSTSELQSWLENIITKGEFLVLIKIVPKSYSDRTEIVLRSYRNRT
jgi:hypothetical protein